MNLEIEIEEADKPSYQTEVAFKWLVKEENIERVMYMVATYKKPDLVRWIRQLCIDESPFTAQGAKAVDWEQVADALYVSLVYVSDLGDDDA